MVGRWRQAVQGDRRASTSAGADPIDPGDFSDARQLAIEEEGPRVSGAGGRPSTS